MKTQRRMSFPEIVQAMMQRTGLSYHQCCVRLGSHGGRAAAAKKRRVAAERLRQEAMRIA